MATKTAADPGIHIDPIKTQTLEVAVLGTMPLIMNRMAEKGLHDLLFPPKRKTAADKAANLKHDPRAEFRAAAYLMPKGSPTYLGIMSTAFKGAMMTAALDMPGPRRAQVGRLVYVEGEHVPVYGVPRMSMAVVRMADINKTPDVRSRPILPRWATLLRVTYVTPLLDARSILNLLAGAGVTSGVGDWRQEKGKGTFGQFQIVNDDDPTWLAIMKEGHEVQRAAMAEPEPYDDLARELLEWFDDELGRRGKAA